MEILNNARKIVETIRNSVLARFKHYDVSGMPSYLLRNASKKIRLDKDLGFFSKIANKIVKDGRTYLDLARLHVLYQCIAQMPFFGNIIEVGVYKGGSLKFLSECCVACDLTRTVFGIDTFTGHSLIDASLDGKHQIHGFGDVNLVDVQKYLASCKNVKLIKRDILDVPLLSLGKIAVMHVDVDVYHATRHCLAIASHALVKGGFVIVDDYGFITCKGAKKAVDEFIELNSDFVMFHLLSGQALLIRRT